MHQLPLSELELVVHKMNNEINTLKDEIRQNRATQKELECERSTLKSLLKSEKEKITEILNALAQQVELG